MLDYLPDDSDAGYIRDAFWRGRLESELIAIEKRLQIAHGEHLVNELLTITNGLRRLGYL